MFEVLLSKRIMFFTKRCKISRQIKGLPRYIKLTVLLSQFFFFMHQLRVGRYQSLVLDPIFYDLKCSFSVQLSAKTKLHSSK